MKTAQLLSACLILLLPAYISGQSNNLVINEFMASNQTTIKDPEFNNYSDWIEIYNRGDNDVNLMGYFLSDDITDLFKWKIERSYIIPSKKYWGFWADDADTNNHTNFKLSKDYGYIAITSPDSIVIDSITYKQQFFDISYGRYPDGANELFYLNEPTPGNSNKGSTFNGEIDPPVITPQSGFYNSSVQINITATNDSSEIYYTTDGRTPTINDIHYDGPFTIEKTKVIRAIEIKDGFISLQSTDASYLINEQTELPVFSLVTDPANFFDDYIGIYVEGKNGITGLCSNSPRNWNQDWERPVHIDFFDSQKELKISMNAGVKINGGCSRIYPQKSLALYARNLYGKNSFDYPFFTNRNTQSYKTITLRTSAQDWWRTMFRDAMIQTLFIGKMNIDYQSYKPSIVFINGEYWGIHNIREKLNEHYIFDNHGIDPDNVDILELNKGLKASNGDDIVYKEMIAFAEKNDLSLQSNYKVMQNYIDIDEYIDYLIAEIYMANSDWPGNNIKLWRRKVPHGKFRWMTFDLDFGFGGNGEGKYDKNSIEHATNPNGPDWPNPPWSTLLFRRMLLNKSFTNEFVQRFAMHMATTFETDRVIRIIDSLQSNIASEIPRQRERWVKSTSYDAVWDNLVEIMREFARKRKPYMVNQLVDKFNLIGTTQLEVKVKPEGSGTIKINGVTATDSVNTYELFNAVPIRISAAGKEGYTFKRWEGFISSSKSNDTATPLDMSQLTAVFELYNEEDVNVVINEINYNSSPGHDTEDWIELINVSGFDVDLSGYTFRDSDTSHYFAVAANTILQDDSLLVLCRDINKFITFNPDVDNVLGNYEFGLSNSGDQILLHSASGRLIDSVEYKDTNPWPIEADGTGATLSLVSAFTDNTDYHNWSAAYIYGTPGRNNILTSIKDTHNTDLPTEYNLYQNYPNPFNPNTIIEYTIPDAVGTGYYPVQQNVTIKIYDILGNEIVTLVNEIQPPGRYKVQFDGSLLASGVYYYQIRSASFITTKKLMLLK